MSELGKRIAVAVPGAALMVFLILYNPFTLYVALGVLVVLMLAEFSELFEVAGWANHFELTLALGAIYFLSLGAIVLMPEYPVPIHLTITMIFFPSTLAIAYLVLVRKGKHFMSAMAVALAGVLYVAAPLYLVFELGNQSNEKVMAVFALLWAADSGAYFAGKALGRTKLFPSLSPKKSWEGLVGGILLAALVGVAGHYLFEVFEIWQWLVLAVAITCFGTLGDLAESALKRQAGVKDSGNLLPGHGGILDRFDGLLVAGPMAWLIIGLF